MDQIKTISLGQVLTSDQLSKCINLFFENPDKMRDYICTDLEILTACDQHNLVPKYFAYMVEYVIRSKS